MLAFTTQLLGDINQLGISSNPDSLIEFNSQAFFVADDGVTGAELWKSDGTVTELVSDLLPGPEGSQPQELTIVDGELFFTAFDDEGEIDLWKTDGSSQGTVQVFDADANGVYYISDLTESGGKLFFNAYEVATGYEIWVHDKSTSGTMLVRDINSNQTVIDRPQELTDVNGTLFFTTYENGYDNRELFKSDGTSAGTVLVKDIDGDPLTSSNPSNLANVNGTLYFAADGGNDGVELFKSDGTSGGTLQVADLNPSGSSYPQEFTFFDNKLFFTANNGTGRHLFEDDGSIVSLVADTTGGIGSSSPAELTIVGTDLFFASNGGLTSGPLIVASPELTPSPNRNSFNGVAGVIVGLTGPDRGQIGTVDSVSVNFTARAGGAGAIGSVNNGLTTLAPGDLYMHDVDSFDLQRFEWEWSVSDAAGLTDIDFSGFISGSDFDGANEGVRFELLLNGAVTSSFDITGAALDNWSQQRTNENLSFTNAGGPTITTATVRMTFRDELPNNNSGTGPDREALVVGAQLTATGATARAVGRELHKTDGTTTEVVKNIVEVGSANPSRLTEAGGRLFFSADDPFSGGRELWSSDGTESGTAIVKDIRTGTNSYGAPKSSDPQQLFEVDGKLFFSAIDNLDDRELWSSDPADLVNTMQVANINEGSQGADISQVTRVGNRIFFAANDGVNGEAVWVADPAAGTVELAADVSGSSVDEITGIVEFNGGVAFFNSVAQATFHTNGTTTTLLTNKLPIPINADGDLFASADGFLYFVHNDGSDGEELYKTTAAGVDSIVQDLNDNDANGSQPRELVAFANDLYFVATQSVLGVSNGREVFRTTGTGAVLVANINTNPDPESSFNNLGSDPIDLTVSGNRLFFSADDGNNGRELWSTTGVGATLQQIRSGTSGSDPRELTDAGGTLYFAANDGTNGFEPYRSTGTTTTLVENINSGNANSDPSGFVEVGGVVYFAASDNATGRELYATNTSNGADLVQDLQPGVFSSNPVPLADAGSDRVLVSAIGTGAVDRELWISGGVVAGVRQAADINPGVFFGSDPRDIVEIGTDRLLIADDGFSGEEVFRLIEFAPEVDTIISDGDAQRSTIETIRLRFDAIVDIIGTPFTVTNTTTNQPVSFNTDIGVELGKTVVDFTFVAGTSVNANGRLLDGEYQIQVTAAGIDSFGLSLDGNGDGTGGDDYLFGNEAVDKFFRKFGDNDGNRLVNLADFGAFRNTFGLSPGDPGYNSAMDDGGDGPVNLADFGAFRGNFGT